jgi:hypothetical protein
LGAEFSVVLVVLSGAMFSSLVELALAGGDAAARAEPSIPLFLGAMVFLGLARAMLEIVLWKLYGESCVVENSESEGELVNWEDGSWS